MMKIVLLITLFISSTLAVATDNAHRLGKIRNLKRFAFGSCNKQYENQNLWVDMISQRPELFIWGGDNAYSTPGH
jgi:alkaline phosphatase D